MLPASSSRCRSAYRAYALLLSPIVQSTRATNSCVFCGLPPPASNGTLTCICWNTARLEGSAAKGPPGVAVIWPRVSTAPLGVAAKGNLAKYACVAGAVRARKSDVGTQARSVFELRTRMNSPATKN